MNKWNQASKLSPAEEARMTAIWRQDGWLLGWISFGVSFPVIMLGYRFRFSENSAVISIDSNAVTIGVSIFAALQLFWWATQKWMVSNIGKPSEWAAEEQHCDQRELKNLARRAKNTRDFINEFHSICKDGKNIVRYSRLGFFESDGNPGGIVIFQINDWHIPSNTVKFEGWPSYYLAAGSLSCVTYISMESCISAVSGFRFKPMENIVWSLSRLFQLRSDVAQSLVDPAAIYILSILYFGLWIFCLFYLIGRYQKHGRIIRSFSLDSDAEMQNSVDHK